MTVLPKEPLNPGQLFEGYKIGDLIAMGHKNAVYDATHDLTGRAVVLRMLLGEQALNPVEVKRCMHAAQAMARVKDAGVVEIYDFGMSGDGLPYTVLRRMEGRSLKEIIKRESPLSAPRIRRLFGQISKSMAAVHAQKIVHRDLKPAHFIVSGGEDETVTIIDFDACCSDSQEKKSLTLAGEIVGTPYYMSPEQCLGLPVDQRSDIYSLGCAMFEAMTGQMPISGDTSLDTMQKQVSALPKLPAELDPEYKGLTALILKCLEKKPEQRYQTMSELHRDLVGDQINTKAQKSWRNKF